MQRACRSSKRELKVVLLSTYVSSTAALAVVWNPLDQSHFWAVSAKQDDVSRLARIQ